MPSPPPSILPRDLLAAVFKDPRTLLAFEAALQASLVTNPGGVAVALTAPNFSAEFGGLSDGSNNDAAFAAAEASDFGEIYLPAGEFVTTLPRSAFQKKYIGPGKIVITGVATVPGINSYIATTPTIYPTQGSTGFFRGDTEHVQPEWYTIGPGTRDYLTNSRYFEAPFIPHATWFDVQSGNSGWLTSAPGALAVGATSAALVSADGISVGNVLGVTNAGMDGAIVDTITVDTVVGATITFHPALSINYPNTDPGRAVFMKSHRTWGGLYYSKITGTAGGDVYGEIWRMNQNYVAKAGQTHFFETSTVGQAGGDVNFGVTSDGTFATGWESIFNDNGADVAVMFSVNSGVRTNDTGARAVVWLGSFSNSTGSKPMDAAHVVSGAWRIGLDTVRADLTNFLAPGDNLNAAINTSLGHRWIMNSTATAGGRGGSTLYGPFYGNTPGDMFIESGNDGSDYIALRFNRAAPNNGRIRLRQSGATVNVPFLGSSTIEAGAELVTGGAVPRVIWGPGLGVWIEWDGANLRATKTNGAAFVNIV